MRAGRGSVVFSYVVIFVVDLPFAYFYALQFTDVKYLGSVFKRRQLWAFTVAKGV